jgi:hypothetical protein
MKVTAGSMPVASIASANHDASFNARLISAAPDLLEAVMRAADWHSGDKWRDGTPEERKAWEEHKDMLDAAIYKATGEKA